MENVDATITIIRDTLERHSQRLLTIEGKLASDYQNIMTLLKSVEQLKAASDANSQMTENLALKVQTLEDSFSTLIEEINKAEQERLLRDVGIKKSLSRQNKLLIFAIVLSSAALIYSTIQNGTTAGAVATILSILTKTWGL